MPAGPSIGSTHAMRLGLRASGFGERDANSFHRLCKAA